MHIPTMLVVLTLLTVAANADESMAKAARSSATKSTLSVCLSPEAEQARPSKGYMATGNELAKLLTNRRADFFARSSIGIDEVIVSGTQEWLPMRDEARGIPSGALAPFWAIAHPTQAWRIFFPIPSE